MPMRRFRRWDWEFDCGIDPIQGDDALPRDHAVANYDDKGRLFRVEIRGNATKGFCGESPTDKPLEILLIDYFCDEAGRILQKRSLDEEGNVHVIVDFDYAASSSMVTESAWYPIGGRSRPIRRAVRPTDSLLRLDSSNSA